MRRTEERREEEIEMCREMEKERGGGQGRVESEKNRKARERGGEG